MAGAASRTGASRASAQMSNRTLSILRTFYARDYALIRAMHVRSSSCASVWFVKLHDITNDGWPVEQPRLSRRPDASTMMLWPSGNVNRSTCGLMLSHWMPAKFSRSSMPISLSKWPMLPTSLQRWPQTQARPSVPPLPQPRTHNEASAQQPRLSSL